MFWRIPALILAAVAYGIWQNGLISLAILVASIPLPWIAVLIANDRPPRRAEEPRRYDSRQPHTAVSDGRAARSGARAHIMRRNRTTASRRAMFPAEELLALFSAHSQVDCRITADQKV